MTDELLQESLNRYCVKKMRSGGLYRSIVRHNKFRFCFLQNCHKQV